MAKERARLDESKPYGQIFGIHEYGGVFEQGGKCFDGAGLEVGPGITPEVDAPRPGAAGPAVTEPTSDEPKTDEPKDNTALEAELQSAHPATLAKLVTEAGEVPHTGAGSKAKNIALLLELNG